MPSDIKKNQQKIKVFVKSDTLMFCGGKRSVNVSIKERTSCLNYLPVTNVLLFSLLMKSNKTF